MNGWRKLKIWTSIRRLRAALKSSFVSETKSRLARSELLLITLFFSAAVHAQEPSYVDLEVNEFSNVFRPGEPITSGVPIRAGDEGAHWALFDGAYEIPVQTKILPGLNTPWLLLDFQTALSAGQKKKLSLKRQEPSAAPSVPILISEDKSRIDVTTGPMRFRINKTDFNLFSAIWKDKNGNGTFSDPGEAIYTAGAESNIFLISSTSEFAFSGRGGQTVFIWEDSGPLRATLRVDGQYKNGSTVLLAYTTRFTFYAGKRFVNIEQVIRNSSQTNELYVKASSAMIIVGGSGGPALRAAKSGDLNWANAPSGGVIYDIIPRTLVISPGYDPIASPQVPRSKVDIDVDGNGGLIIGDMSHHSAALRVDFSENYGAGTSSILAAAAKDPVLALAPASWYSDLGVFGSEHFSTYDDEKNANLKLGWTWPTPGKALSYEHDRPRVPDYYPSWSVIDSTNDPEADDLWQNLVMFARVRIPFYLDRARGWARYWKSEWTFRTDGFSYNGAWGDYWDGPRASARPKITPPLTTDDETYINSDIKNGKAGLSHMWNGGAIDYYYLTGDRDALQAALDTAEHCELLFSWRDPGAPASVVSTNSRAQARCLLAELRAWEATKDSRWKASADHLMSIFLRSSATYDARGFYYGDICNSLSGTYCSRFPGGKFFVPFMMNTVAEAFYRYYLLTGNSAVRAKLIEFARFGRDFGLEPATGYGGDVVVVDWPEQGAVRYMSYAEFRGAELGSQKSYGSSSFDFINSMVIAYRLTGFSSYLNRALEAWSKGSKGSASGSFAGDGQVGFWVNSLQGRDPGSMLFTDGGDWANVSYLFYELARSNDKLIGEVANLRSAAGLLQLSSGFMLRPFPNYYGGLWSRTVKLASSPAELVAVCPNDPTSLRAIKIFRSNRVIQQIRLSGGSVGLQCDLLVDPGSDKVFLAASPKAGSAEARVYEITKNGAVTAGRIPKIYSGSPIVQFVKIGRDRYALVSAAEGVPQSLTAWHYDSRRGSFFQEKTLTPDLFTVSGGKISRIGIN